MEDQQGKYLRLFGTMFFVFIGFIVSILLVLTGLRFFFGLFKFIPWFTYIYIVFILLVPSALFISVYLIYFKRSKFHPSKSVRIISNVFFITALACWAFCLGRDMITFFQKGYTDIGRYFSYNMIFLVANVAGIFLIGVLQALTTAKEKDWMERNQA
ncbi:MAG: hypothetical protein V9E88_15640 [Ferruginibacter sp.]